MKFQNSCIHGSKVMLCIKKRDKRTDGRKDGRTDGQTTQKQYAPPPPNFFEVGSIIKINQTPCSWKYNGPKSYGKGVHWM